jgi:hypothetical protein
VTFDFLHRGARHRDSLDVLMAAEDKLGALKVQWDKNDPDDLPPEKVAIPAYERGNVVKLLLEHGALRVAAQRDVVEALRRRRQSQLADQVDVDSRAVRKLLDWLEEESRGVQPVSLGAARVVADYAGKLLGFFGPDELLERRVLLSQVRQILGRHSSSGLRSEHFIDRHAPVHPAPEPQGFKVARPLLWLRARWDRLRGFPWAENSPFGDPKLDRRYGVKE